MSVKALRKQLLAAVAMVIVAAIAVSSSTFAWFAANTEVEATGMTVSAVSDSVFLEIAGESDTSKTVFSTLGTSTIDVDLKPVSHESWSALANITDFDIAVADTYDNWYYRYSSAVDDEMGTSPSAKTYISSFTGYVASTTFDVQLNANSGPNTAYDLYVSEVTIPASKGIHLVVAGDTGYVELTNADSGSAIAYAAANQLCATVGKAAASGTKTITAYIFFDGNEDVVYTDNITNLQDVGVSFKMAAFTEAHA